MTPVVLRNLFRLCYNGAWKLGPLSSLTQRILHKVHPLGHLYSRFLLQPSLPASDVVLAFDDQRIWVHNPKENVIGQEIFLRGLWEPEVTKFVCPRINPGMTVIDVGADIGYYTLLFAKRVGEGGRVCAFEPIPKARATLERNVGLNRYENVTIFDYALYDASGTFVLEGPLEASRINPAKNRAGEKDLEIQTRVFDDCFAELSIQTIDLVKIDVEGAEINVLKGMKRCLQEFHPNLLVEVHPAHLSKFEHRAEELLQFLRELRYDIYPIDKSCLDFKSGNITIYGC